MQEFGRKPGQRWRGINMSGTVTPNFNSSDMFQRDRASPARGMSGLSLRTDTDPANALSSAHEARGMWESPVISTMS